MSLINDALKRAREAQPPTSTPSSVGHELHPLVATPRARHNLGLLLPASLAVVALLVLLLMWELSHRGGSTSPNQASDPLPVTARTLPATDKVPATVEQPKAPQPAPLRTDAVGSAPAASGTKSGVPAVTHNDPSGMSEASSGTNPVTAGSGNADTNQGITTETSPAPPPVLKLQGIVFDRRRPSAVISGHTLFLGDRIRDLRLVSISQDSVVLAGQGRTNLLSLEP